MSQSIWGSADRGPVVGTYRIPVDTGSSSSPGYITATELRTFLAPVTRSISSVSTNTAAGATAFTDYVYIVTGTSTITLPTAVGNTNKYTVVNAGVGTVTTATTSAQTINGAANSVQGAQASPYYPSEDYISDGANWFIV